MTFLNKPEIARQLIESWPDGLIGLDHYGKIIFCNEKTKKILGWSDELLIGKEAHGLLCSKAADYSHEINDCPMCIRDKQGQSLDHFEAWWVGANGVYINLDVRVLEPNLPDLDLSKILMFSECSSGTVSQFQARRLAMFAEFSPVPILEVEATAAIEFANPAMTDLMVEYGFNDEGIPNVLPAALEAIVAEVIASEVMRVNEEVEYNDKSFVWTFNPLSKNNKNFVQIYGLDVTELRRAQTELEAAKNIAERASEAKSHFLANMSHEIRTPMNAIVGFTEILMRSKLAEKQIGYCNKIKISSTVLLEVINDILDFSKIEAGKLQLESTPFNLVENIEVLADLFSDRANDAGLHIIFDIDQNIPAVVVGDSLRLKQIMINLVSNALKFTRHGYIEVTAKAVRSKGEYCRIRFEIRDTGKGIHVEKQSQLFAPFTQEDESTSRKYGGTGLGLSICRSLVELMDGSIGVRSKEGQGSVFFFEANFGVSDGVSVLERQLTKLTVEADCKTILLIESHPIQRRSLRHQLTAYGFQVVEFAEGMALVDEFDWLEQRNTIRAIFVDEEPENIAWVEAFAKALGGEGYYPFLMSVVKLSQHVNWSAQFLWPVERLLSCERPLKPSIVGRTILTKLPEANSKLSMVAKIIDTRARKTLKGFTILVVDDNAFNRELLIELLQDTEVGLETADDGQSAIHLVHINSYDLILMDIQMPIMDGFEASKIIRSRKPHQVIIAVTANAIKGDHERFINAGFDDYISKPVDSDKLLDMIYFWADKMSQPLEHPEAGEEDHVSQENETNISDTQVSREQVFDIESKSETENEIPTEYKGLKIAKALIMLGNKRSLYFKLMKIFSENYSTTGDAILKALREEDTMTAGRLVHTIKGSASNLGAENLQHRALHLEDAILKQNDSTQSQLLEFCAELDETITVMNDFVERYKHLA